MSQTVEMTPRRRSPIRRVGCGASLVLWFLLLLTPCFCFVLASQGEIIIPQGSAPGQQIRIWLIMEVQQRGFGISSAAVSQPEPNALCVESRTRFLLWVGSAESSVSCECYMRASEDEAWAAVSVENRACETGG
jgi:hypothetical protein